MGIIRVSAFRKMIGNGVRSAALCAAVSPYWLARQLARGLAVPAAYLLRRLSPYNAWEKAAAKKMRAE